MKKTALIFLGLVSVLMIHSCKEKVKEERPEKMVAEVNYLEESEEDFNKRMQWWRDDAFGMFIHWGAYAVPAGIYKGKEIDGIGEWIMYNAKIPINEYEGFARAFDPQKLDADQWARTIKEAGIKYVVITSKHHDGFGLWDSKVSDYDIVDSSPYGKDILKQLSIACRKQGIKFGTYHSIMDWHHPQAQADTYLETREVNQNDSLEFATYLEDYMKPQLKELIDNYDVDMMWFDGEWIEEFTHDQGKALYQYVRSLKPDIIINNRVDKGRQGMQGMNKGDADYAGDFGTPEQEILEGTAAVDWESCMTINDTWGFKKNDHNWKSAETLIHNLIDVAAKGGNYLLNVGPTAAGLIPEPSVERLQEMGKWLGVNGAAIYKTEKLKGSFKQGEHIRFTKSKDGSTIYAISLKKPTSGKLGLANIRPKEGSAIVLLGSDAELDWEYDKDKGLTIFVPKSIPGNYAWTFKIEGDEFIGKK